MHSNPNIVSKPGGRRHLFQCALMVVSFAVGGNSLAATPDLWAGEGNNKPQVELVPAQDGLLRDIVGDGAVEVRGGVLEKDDRFGECVAFGGGKDNEIVLKDGGRFDFSQGFTFEGWVRFEEQDPKQINGGLFFKLGTLVCDVDKGKISPRWITLPTEKVYAKEGQIGYHPVETNNFNGAREVPLQQWVHVAITYDPKMRVLRSWIDRGIDRERYLTEDEEADVALQINPKNPIVLFKGMKDFKLAGVRLAGEAVAVNALPKMEVYLHQLPYHGKGQIGLIIDHISPELKFPVEMVAYWENHTGHGNVIKRFALDDAKRKVINFDVPGWKNAIYSLHLQAFEDHREIQRWAFQVANPLPSPTANIRFGPDMMPIRDGKKFFPLLIYRVPGSDFQKASDMGFNIITPYSYKKEGPRVSAEKIALFKEWFAEAKAANVMLIPGVNPNQLLLMQEFAEEKSLFAWNTADEPWGVSLERLRNVYNTIKTISPDVPVYIVQNNTSRVQESSELCDIIARDIYPVPSVPFRAIVDGTRKAIRDSGGFKPVWMIVCQYETKIPTREELRCMLYLGIVAGANGVGIYSWDDRVLDPKTNEPAGWYLPEHPEAMENLRIVTREIADMQHILVEPNDPDISSHASGNKAVHVAKKSTGDGDYLFLVNDSRQAENATVTLGDAQNGKGQDIHTKEKEIVLKNGSASVSLAPFEVSVYRFEKGALK